MEKMVKEMNFIEAANEEIKESISVNQYENVLMMMTTLFRSEIRDKRDMVLCMAEGIYKGL